MTVETKKIRELLAAVDKGRAHLEADRKTYCEDFKRTLQQYVFDEQIGTNTYIMSIQGVIKRLEMLNDHYLKAIEHIQKVSMPALGYLPKRMEALKKPIKVVKLTPAEVPKIQDFEWERLENLKLAMLHFFNAKMYLHAKALELYSEAYENLRGISLRSEFRHVDQATLRQVFAQNPHIAATPRGGGGQSSSRASLGG